MRQSTETHLVLLIFQNRILLHLGPGDIRLSSLMRPRYVRLEWMPKDGAAISHTIPGIFTTDQRPEQLHILALAITCVVVSTQMNQQIKPPVDKADKASCICLKEA